MSIAIASRNCRVCSAFRYGPSPTSGVRFFIQANRLGCDSLRNVALSPPLLSAKRRKFFASLPARSPRPLDLHSLLGRIGPRGLDGGPPVGTRSGDVGTHVNREVVELVLARGQRYHDETVAHSELVLLVVDDRRGDVDVRDPRRRDLRHQQPPVADVIRNHHHRRLATRDKRGEPCNHCEPNDGAHRAPLLCFALKRFQLRAGRCSRGRQTYKGNFTLGRKIRFVKAPGLTDLSRSPAGQEKRATPPYIWQIPRAAPRLCLRSLLLRVPLHSFPSRCRRRSTTPPRHDESAELL